MKELFNYLYQKGEENLYEEIVENFFCFHIESDYLDPFTYADVWVKENQVSFTIWKKRLSNCWEIYRTVRFSFSFLFSISTISYDDIVVVGRLFEKSNGTPHTKTISLSKLKKYLYPFMESEWVLDKEYKFRGFDEYQKPIFSRRYKGYISIGGVNNE